MNRVCYIKVILNPTLHRLHSLEFRGEPKPGLYVKIVLKHPAEIETVINEIKETVMVKHTYKVQFNWKNVPESVRRHPRIPELVGLFSPN